MKIISKFFTLVVVLLPALNCYTGFVPSIELGTLLVILCTLFLSFGGKQSYTFGHDIVWLLLAILFFVGTGIATTYNYNYSVGFFFRLLKIFVIVCSVFWLGKPYLRYDYAIKVLTFFSLLSAVYIIMQSVAFYGAGIQLPGIFAPLAYDEEHDYGNLLNGRDAIFRPSSFFMEPAQFASYEFVFLCYLLAHTELKRRTLYLIIIIVGLFVSTSGTAYAMIPLLFIISYFLGIRQNQGKKKNGVMKGFLIAVLGVAVFAVLVFYTDIGAITIGRLFDSGETTVAVTGRLESEAKWMFAALPSDWKILGCGFGFRPQDVYMPSFYAILYGDGYIGVTAVLLLIIYYFFKTSNFGKLLCLSFGALFFSSGIFNFASIGLYFLFISKETILCKYVQKHKV